VVILRKYIFLVRTAKARRSFQRGSSQNYSIQVFGLIRVLGLSSFKIVSDLQILPPLAIITKN
jgi:hypothetical protein